MNNIQNRDNIANSLQISKLGNIPEGEFTSEQVGTYFLIKNITEENITVSIKMPEADDYINTVMYPGWNVELVAAIKNATSNTLQYGY